MTNEDMMIQAARLILSTDVDGKAAGRTKVKHSPFQLIVHQVNDRADSQKTWVHTEHGDVELRKDQAERVARQAEIVPAAKPVADPSGKTPPWLVKRVLARDNQRCQNCGRSLHLQVHHVEFRSMGGKTEEGRLAAVCTTCHSLIHIGLLRMHGDGAGGFVFLDQSGAGVERKSTPIPVAAVRHTALAKMPRTDVDQLFSSLLLLGTRRELAPSLQTRLLPGYREMDTGSRTHARVDHPRTRLEDGSYTAPSSS